MKTNNSQYCFTYKADHIEITCTLQADTNVEELFHFIKGFLLATGWHPDTVKEILNEDE